MPHRTGNAGAGRSFRREAVLVAVVVAVMVSWLAAIWALSGDGAHGRAAVRSGHPGRSTLPTHPVGLLSDPMSLGEPVIPSIVAENRRVGTDQWRIPAGTVTTAIEGYADRVSAVQGDTVNLYVSTASPFHVEAYRMGYYGGAGARLVWTSAEQPAVVQPKPVVVAPNRMVDARWHPTLPVTIGTDWYPGDYLLKLVGGGPAQHYVPITVRDDSSHAAVEIVNAVTTWQAYNFWGGYSLYKGPRADPSLRSNIVSFDRPYDGTGAGEFVGNEYPLVSLAEQMGLDVTYVTSVDVAAHPDRLPSHRAIVSLGHDEYWSVAMRTGVEAARDHGTNLAFLGANAVFRRIRFEPSTLGPMRHEVNYRSARLDPDTGKDNAQVTTSWREAPAARPESSLTGVLYECNPVNVDGVVADASSWVFAGSGLQNGDRIPGMVGSEYDRVTPQVATPASIQVLFHSPLTCRGHHSFSDAAYYTAPSGAGVFSTGTGAWICKLLVGCPADRPMVPDPRIRLVTENVLRAFADGPAGAAHPSTSNLAALRIVKGASVASTANPPPD
ncbi:MAG: hypothetical protein JWL73_177 [Actinomycetia bacterium]|nr:hypothetical protein [Actinomycetes bacterium]